MVKKTHARKQNKIKKSGTKKAPFIPTATLTYVTPQHDEICNEAIVSSKNNQLLLELVIMVANGVHVIGPVLEAMLPIIDHWTVYDTGSKDGTQELVKEKLSTKPGHLYEGNWGAKFDMSRNKALDLAGERCTFSIMLDDSYVVHGVEYLREFLQQHQNGDQNGFLIGIPSTFTYYSARIYRTQNHVRYHFPVHEVNNKDIFDKVPVEHSWIEDTSSDDTIERSHQRWERDKVVILDYLQEHPNHPRMLFYLAQTYRGLGDYEKAYRCYEKRHQCVNIQQDFIEERFEAIMQQAIIGRDHLKKDWERDTFPLFILAHTICMYRAEPLYEIAAYYRDKNNSLCYAFIHRASKIPYPSGCALFVQTEIYDFKIPNLLGIIAYYVDEYRSGYKAVKKAMQSEYAQSEWQFLVDNLEFYKTKLSLEEQKRLDSKMHQRNIVTEKFAD